MAVFLPLFSMAGIEGRMYQPLVVVVIAAVCASLLLALTALPADVATRMSPVFAAAGTVTTRRVAVDCEVLTAARTPLK